MNGLDKVIEHLNHAHLDALLNPPTDDMILEHLKKEMGHIPADYIEFLKRCNGLTLYHSGDYCLFDAQEILSFHFSNDNLLCRSAWKIGYWMGYDIVINVDDIEKEYLYAGDCCSTDEFVCVGNILNFIEEIVKNGGDPYWTMDIDTFSNRCTPASTDLSICIWLCVFSVVYNYFNVGGCINIRMNTYGIFFVRNIRKRVAASRRNIARYDFLFAFAEQMHHNFKIIPILNRQCARFG